MDEDELRGRIRHAFAGVKLGKGMSLSQAAWQTEFGMAGPRLSPEAYHALGHGDQRQDWTAVVIEEANDTTFLTHLDAEAFRFYLPVYMTLALRDLYFGGLGMIHLLGLLCPQASSFAALATFDRLKYQALSAEQLQVIPVFLRWLRNRPDVDPDDQATIDRALGTVWSREDP